MTPHYLPSHTHSAATLLRMPWREALRDDENLTFPTLPPAFSMVNHTRADH